MAALVQCRDCGQKISKRAAKCPNCGAPVKKKTSGCLVVFALIVIIGIITMIIENNNATTSTSSNTSTSPKAIAHSEDVQAKNETPRTTTSHQSREPEKSNHATEARMPSEANPLPTLKKPPEPDWNERNAYWSAHYDKTVEQPVLGTHITVKLSTGVTKAGVLSVLTPDAVTLTSGRAELSLERRLLDDQSQRHLWPDAFRRVYVLQQIYPEKKRYAALLATAYDDVIRDLEKLSEDLVKTTEGKVMQVSGKVSQVIDDDALVFLQGYDQPVYVEGIGSSVVDGSIWNGTIFFSGTKTYVSVLGASKKVIKCTINPPIELIRNIKQLDVVQKEIASLKGMKQIDLTKY
jgi:3D (Asp-Asp-Asp) domain-containing protein